MLPHCHNHKPHSTGRCDAGGGCSGVKEKNFFVKVISAGVTIYLE